MFDRADRRAGAFVQPQDRRSAGRSQGAGSNSAPAAKKAKDFAKADALRAQIAALGWTVTDTAQGPQLTQAITPYRQGQRPPACFDFLQEDCA